MDPAQVLYLRTYLQDTVKQWRQLLSCPGSKTNLIEFLVKDWQDTRLTKRLAGRIMYVTFGQKCFKTNANQDGSEIPELKRTQEEADTQMLIHVLHAANDFETVTLVADDTDVFILSFSSCDKLNCNLFLKCGSKACERFIDIKKLALSLGKSVCKALLGLHSYTGCDTVSAFAGKGKVVALNLLKANETYRKAFIQLGEQWTLTDELFNALQDFTCHM